MFAALLLCLSHLCRPAAAATLLFGASDGKVSFHNVASLHEFDGVAQRFSGSFDPATLSGTLVVEAASLTTWLGPRDDKLKLYCLETEKYPEITLRITTVNGAVEGLKRGEGGGSITLVGVLTIRDVQKVVNIPTTWRWEDGALRLQGKLLLAWPDWKIPDPSIVFSSLSPEMTASFDVVARPANAAANPPGNMPP